MLRFLAVAAAALTWAVPAMAHGTRFGLSLFFPLYLGPPAYYPPPPPVYYYPPSRPVYYAPPAPAYVTPAPPSSNCREFRGDATIDANGGPFYGTACLGADGRWHIVN